MDEGSVGFDNNTCCSLFDLSCINKRTAEFVYTNALFIQEKNKFNDDRSIHYLDLVISTPFSEQSGYWWLDARRG